MKRFQSGVFDKTEYFVISEEFIKECIEEGRIVNAGGFILPLAEKQK